MVGIKGGAMMMQVQAFSLIELMVVVAIVGALSVTALPSYQQYVIRSKITSVLQVAETVKVDVMEEHSYGTVFGATDDVKIASNATSKPAYLDQLTRTNYGCVEILYDLAQLGLENGGGEVLALMVCPAEASGTNVVSWNCGYSADTTVDYTVYLPPSCRQLAVQDTAF